MKPKNRYFLIATLLIVVLATLGILRFTVYYGQSKSKHTTPPTVATALTPSQKTNPTTSVNPIASACNCSWAITSSTSVEFLVISPSGQKTGFMQSTQSYVSEIPDASYGPESGIANDTGQGSPSAGFLYFGMNNAENGKYELEVIGKEGGKYHLDISFAWGSENGKQLPFDGTLDSGQVDKYTITFPEGIVQKVNN